MTGEEEWHAWRALGVGASEVAGILGISPWATPTSVYAEKVHGISTFAGNDDTDFGSRIEAIMPDWFHDDTGLYVVGEQTWCTHTEHKHHRATVDGFVAESPESDIDDVLGVYEGKAAQPIAWDEVPAHYQAQVQWQLHVTGLQYGWLWVLHGRKPRAYVVERDDEDIAFIVAEVDRFWHDHVLAKVPPPVDASQVTARTLAALYPQQVPGVEVEVPASFVAELAAARLERKSVERRCDQLENELRALLGDAEIATVDGRKVATWKTQTARRIDLGRLEADHPEIADKYRTESTTRVLRVSTPKESA